MKCSLNASSKKFKKKEKKRASALIGLHASLHAPVRDGVWQSLDQPCDLCMNELSNVENIFIHCSRYDHVQIILKPAHDKVWKRQLQLPKKNARFSVVLHALEEISRKGRIFFSPHTVILQNFGALKFR